MIPLLSIGLMVAGDSDRGCRIRTAIMPAIMPPRNASVGHPPQGRGGDEPGTIAADLPADAEQRRAGDQRHVEVRTVGRWNCVSRTGPDMPSTNLNPMKVTTSAPHDEDQARPRCL